MTIGERIAEFRKRRGITQAALAEMLGVTDKAVSKWERDISCPDVALLSDLSSALGVTTDEILQGENEISDEAKDRFISLEKYLMGDFGYTVPDLHPINEKITLIMDSPDMDEADHGYALSGKVGCEVNRFLFDESEPFSFGKLKEGCLGVTYISNVPLGNLTYPITRIMGELEYTRLNKFHINRMLLNECMKKLERLVLSDTVSIIALTREFNKKYFGAFVSYADPKILSLLQDKIASGALKILYVENPRFWNTIYVLTRGEHHMLKEYINKI